VTDEEKIHEKPRDSCVPVRKWMHLQETIMRVCREFQDIEPAGIGINAFNELLHLFETRRAFERARYPDIRIPVPARISNVYPGKNDAAYVKDDPLGEMLFLFDKAFHQDESLLMIKRLKNLQKVLSFDRDALFYDEPGSFKDKLFPSIPFE
jgi:hypothetical protein